MSHHVHVFLNILQNEIGDRIFFFFFFFGGGGGGGRGMQCELDYIRVNYDQLTSTHGLVSTCEP